MISYYFRDAKALHMRAITAARGGSWANIVDPDGDEKHLLMDKFGLDEGIIRDALDAYEAPRIDEDDSGVYFFVRYCSSDSKSLATAPMMIAITNKHFMTISKQQNNPIVESIISKDKGIVTTHKVESLLQTLEYVTLSYRDSLNKVGKQLLRLRGGLSKTDINNDDFVVFIDIEEDLNEYISALQAQELMLMSLATGKILRMFEEDRELVEDLQLSTKELLEIAKSRLKTITNIRDAYSTIMANNLNKTFKRLTSISIFITIPTIVSTLFGMNVALPFRLGYNGMAFWIISFIVIAASGLTIWLFKLRKWL